MRTFKHKIIGTAKCKVQTVCHNTKLHKANIQKVTSILLLERVFRLSPKLFVTDQTEKLKVFCVMQKCFFQGSCCIVFEACSPSQHWSWAGSIVCFRLRCSSPQRSTFLIIEQGTAVFVFFAVLSLLKRTQVFFFFLLTVFHA